LLKAADNPTMIWPEGKMLREFAGQWWVAHTKSRNEKALAGDLAGKGISYFLPMSWKVKKIRGRTVKSLLPIFGGYLFFCGNENQRVETLKTNRVANIIDVRDQRRLIEELSQIEQAIAGGANLSPHNYLKVGQKCKVIGGALAGLSGIVEKTRNETRLVLQIDMLGQAASVDIGTDMIEVVEETEEN
jgi:transcription termination/antitermination protein NusG